MVLSSLDKVLIKTNKRLNRSLETQSNLLDDTKYPDMHV